MAQHRDCERFQAKGIGDKTNSIEKVWGNVYERNL